MQNPKEELAGVRREIDAADKEMVALFARRMELADKIARIKKEGNLSIADQGREQAVIEQAARQADPELQGDVRMLMSSLIAFSRRRQTKKLMRQENLSFPLSSDSTPARIGYQGLAGAWGEMAALSLFPHIEPTGLPYFEDVFEAVRDGAIDTGVLPIENSHSGAIGEVYDLLRRYGCYITGQVWVEARHCLLAKPGTSFEQLRRVLSHPEGFRQCHHFLKNHAWDKIPCNNTAVAARMVAEGEDTLAAAIGSQRAAEVYGLEVLSTDITDNSHNRTRFIAIAKQPCYTEKSDTVSVTFSTAHKAGALCFVLETFMAGGINLTRIESRPTGPGKYRFFADLQANIQSQTVGAVLGQAAALCEYFEILGCY